MTSRADRRPEPAKEYLAAIEAGIPRWLRGRRAAVAELGDGLDDAISDYRLQGLPPDEAAIRAVRDSGPASVIAGAFTTTLSAVHARHTALALLASGPFIGLVWLTALAPGRPPTELLVKIPPLGLFILASITICVATLLATGPGRLRPPWAQRHPSRLAAAACACAVAGDALLLGSALTTVVAVSGWSPSLALICAVLLSLTRLAITQRVARRDLVSAGA
ncbi:hypothetical protein [Microbacterium sp. SS28]|uniref:hypothetical protein n=1 Tax=Microbacterium sp. SS28 TaxID=2919948 RepID=UPI001FA9882C|nr:hypothetical protein [Microbacterium sp. SS28]